ncbi:MAG: urease accessory protein UreF [Usitatibacter sp.]
MNVRLLQLASPSLPVGAFSYSQGLEAAVEAGIVNDAASASRWIGDLLELSMQTMEAPVFLRLAASWAARDDAAACRWNEEFIAARDTAELRAETLQMGYSLRSLLRDLGVDNVAALDDIEELAYPTAFAFAVAIWRIDPREALTAYVFAWLESQALAALKSVPLGQTDGQKILLDLAQRIPALVERAAGTSDDALANFAPGLAMLSARHETQYSRIFRS